MSHPLEELRDAALREIAAAPNEQSLEAARVRYLGRSGSISAWGEQMKSLSKEERPIVGKLLNEARTAVTAAIEEAAKKLRDASEMAALANIDISLPGTSAELGQSSSAHANARSRDRDFPPHGIRSRGWARRRGRMALLRRAQHAARSSGPKRAGHFFFARWPACCARTLRPCRSARWKQRRRRFA